MTAEVLTYSNNKFLFKTDSERLTAKLLRNPQWTSLGASLYETRNLGAAVALRCYGDEKTKNIITRATQTHYTLPSLPLLPELDPHQQEGLRWILERKRSYLAHCPGAGKSAQAILGATYAEGKGSSVIIVPPGLALNWEREIRKVTEWVGVFPAIGIVRTSDRQEEVAWRADYLIVPDSMLTKDWVYEKLLTIKKKLIAVDEASRFKESTSERSLAFYGGRNGEKNYPGLFRTARHVVFLDGSPMPNRTMEIWAPAYALHPESIDYLEHDDFGFRYCGARLNERGVWEFLYSSNEEELRSKLQKDFIHFVGESSLNHPQRRRSMLFMDKDVRTMEQKTWEKKHLTSLELSEKTSRGEVARFRKELGMRKIPWIVRYVKERLENKNESILLFVWHREVCEALYKTLGDNVGLVYGGTKPDVRELWFKKFQEGKCKLIIGNILAMGRGHNLQNADRVIFGEFSWSNEINLQCEKRASRRGSTKEFIRSEYIVCPNSMDEKVMQSIFRKETMVRKVLG